MLQNICVSAYKRLGIFLQLNQAMNYDFCPWANAYVYWLKKPIGWFVLGLLAPFFLGSTFRHRLIWQLLESAS